MSIKRGRAYGYIRVSTETQEKKGYGMDTQQEDIERYATDQGLELAGIFTDAGISGALADDADEDALSKRQGLLEMLDTITEGDTIIVKNTSRLWRSDNAKALIRREIIRRKATIASVEQPTYDLYTKDPNERLINGMMELLDEYERMSIALKLARGRATKARKGTKPAGITPFGYRHSQDRKTIEVNQEEAQAVKQAFSMAQSGASLQKIADTLTQQGIPTRGKSKGKPNTTWTRQAVHYMLKNGFYTGTLTHGSATITGTHEPIISKVQFGKVSAMLTRNRRNKG